jgi:ribosomal protein S18 acetylase RimI-like enzyme
MNSFYEITDINDAYYQSFLAIYSVSFPEHEQRNREQQLTAFSDNRYHLSILTENDQVVSFIAWWNFPTYVYIEHFAVSPEFRGKNIGSNMINTFADRIKKTIVIEIDPPINDISRKRLAFYEKVGYKANPHKHFHPPYNPKNKPHELLVLTLNKEFDRKEYEQFSKDLSNIVMK